MRYLTLSGPVHASRFCRDKLNCHWVQQKHDFDSDVDSGVVVRLAFVELIQELRSARQEHDV